MFDRHLCAHHRRVLLLSGLLLGLLLPSTARAEPLIRIGEGFAPHPFVSELIKVRIERVYLSDAGFQKCGSSFTTKAPAFTFELTEKLTDLNLFFATTTGQGNPSVVVVFPNGAYACSNQGNFRFPEWPAGNYKVFYFSSAIGAAASVRIEQPARLKREVFAAFGKTPKILFDGSAATNPQFVELPPTPAAFARELEFGCAGGLSDVRPLARVEVKEAGLYRLMVYGGSLIVASEKGCVKDEATRRNNTIYNNQYSLKPGSYSLWSYGQKEPKPLIIQAGDDQRPLLFGDAEVKELGALAEPLLISGTTRAGERWPSRRNACRGSGRAARAPDFYFQTTEPLPQVELSLFRNKERVAFRFYGPIDHLEPYSRMFCDEDRRTFGKLDGKYAIWLTAAPKAGPSSYDLLVMRKDLKVDPMQTLRPIPEELEGLAGRRVADAYPFFGKMSHGYLFPKAPERLFVWAAQAFGSGDQKVLAGEPLLLLGIREGSVNLVRYDGAKVRAPESKLLTERPVKTRLPVKPAFRPAKDWKDAWRLVGPMDQKLVARMEAVSGKYNSCVRNWMKKNDPTWGKDYDLVWVSGRNTGKTLSDTKFAQAGRVCGEGKVIAAEKNFARQVNLAARKRATRHLSSVRKQLRIGR